MGHPDAPTIPPARAIPSAVVIDSSVPTHSSGGVDPDAAGERQHGLDGRLAALADDVGGAELAGELLARGIAATTR